MEPICPTCHVAVRATDYFCYNCGKNLHPKPISLSFTNLFTLFLGSIMLPPMGIIWGFKYLREKSSAAKLVGITAMVITVIELVLMVKFTIDAVNLINSQVNSQLMNLQGL